VVVSQKVQARVPDDIANSISSLAAEQFAGRLSDAVAYVLAAGLEAVTGEALDPGLADKPALDEVDPFRRYLLEEFKLQPRHATVVASLVRSALRSGDARKFVKSEEVEQRIRSNRESAWRYWLEYCLVHDIDPTRVRVARM
jgi:hypothetical protein